MKKLFKTMFSVLLVTIIATSTQASALGYEDKDEQTSVANTQVARTVVYKDIDNWRVVYTSLADVEDPYYYTEYDPEYNTTFRGSLDLDRVEKVGSVYYAYYSGTVLAYI